MVSPVTTSLKSYSSLRVGGEGNIVFVSSTAELVEASMYAARVGLRIHILGEGTNTFFGDSLSNILFIKMEIKGVSIEEQSDQYLLTISAGERWDDIVKLTVEKNMWGIENLSLIPGTVGAAPVQNIGAYGVELADRFVSLSALDMKTNALVSINKEACAFGYRDSLFKHEKGRYWIVSVTLCLSKKQNPKLTYSPLTELVGKENLSLSDIRECVIATRKAKLPDWREYPNTGSFFKNPIVTKVVAGKLRGIYPSMPLIQQGEDYKIPAAWLIEHVAGMKGVRVSDIGTWPNQPLVIVNYGQSSSQEVVLFSDSIIQKIADKTGVLLEREVHFIE